MCSSLRAALADKLPDLLPLALQAARAIQYENFRADALSALVPRLLQMPADQLLLLLRDTLHLLSLHTRPRLLQDIAALVPVICALGGQEAVAEVVHAIQDVARWWP